MMQPQMGIFNPQLPLLNNVGYMNGTNQLRPAQNNNLGFPPFGPFFPNLNNVAMLQQLSGQFNNPLQNPNQPNWLNLPQQNNMGLTNGQLQQQQQLFLQNQLQNMGQLLNLQIPNLSQFVSGGQTMGFLNTPSTPFGFLQPNQIQPQVNQSQQNLSDVNASRPMSCAAASQVLGDPSFRRPMGDPGKNGQNLNKSSGRNINRFKKSAFQQTRFHQADNGKRKFASSIGHKKKGQNNERAAKFPCSNSANSNKEQRRSFALTYTEQEIQKWREERKKYYPTKANIKKKLSGKVADSEVAKLRSEQLKEILAKQAELGVEVAEIPSHYLLLGSEKKVNGREVNSGPSTKRGRFETRRDKRRRTNKRDRFSQKRRSTNEESVGGTSFNKRSPTLLQKLLSADIRKDKSRLLQVFRFMVINSFFKDWPEKPLKFPLVVVKDGVSEGDEMVAEKPLLVRKDNIEVFNKTMIQSTVDGNCDHKNKDGDAGGEHGNHNENADDIDDDDQYDTQPDQVASFVEEKADIGEEIVRNDEEEGEIIE